METKNTQTYTHTRELVSCQEALSQHLLYKYSDFHILTDMKYKLKMLHWSTSTRIIKPIGRKEETERKHNSIKITKLILYLQMIFNSSSLFYVSTKECGIIYRFGEFEDAFMIKMCLIMITVWQESIGKWFFPLGLQHESQIMCNIVSTYSFC